jgi:hypothetical protein
MHLNTFFSKKESAELTKISKTSMTQKSLKTPGEWGGELNYTCTIFNPIDE